METDAKVNSDRAANDLKTVRTVCDGEYNYEIEIEAVEDGIELEPTGIFISWEWLERAKAVLASHGAGKRPE